MLEIKDIGNPGEEFNKLTERFKLLHNRLLAIAMDYKYYINSEITDNKIYELRDNVTYRLHSARFHFQLLLEQHHRVEASFKKLHSEDPREFFNNGLKFVQIHEQSTREIYSLFDSMLYHLCSIFDYLCQIINYASGKEVLKHPKWNVLILDKNVRENCYCNAELIPSLQKVDSEFVYPLITHRSNLIHTKQDTGGFTLKTDLQGTALNLHFFATHSFKTCFPKIQIENENFDLTIKYTALWLFDQTIKSATDVLFELSDDMKRNKKIPQGFFAMIGPNGTLQSPSAAYWGDRSIT